MKFSSHGRKYELTSSGAIHQLDAKPYVYDAAYSATYDSPEYTKQSDKLMNMRLGFVMGVRGNKIGSLMDFGYGNGAFLKVAKDSIKEVSGYDITGVFLPGVVTSNKLKDLGHAEVVTFWDAFEHLPDLSILQEIFPSYVVISLPYCHANSQGLDWFNQDYKHRKPDEHLWHFDERALENTLDSLGYKAVAASNFEDVVRKSTHGLQNILTMGFKRK